MENLDIYALLDELQEEIDLSPGKLFSKSKSVDPKVMSEIIADIRAALDEALDMSKRIIQEREQIMGAARSQAEQTINEAELRAKEMISEDAITKSAYEQCGKMLEKANQKSFEIKKSAINYASEIFADLDNYYKESTDILNENRNRLNALLDTDRER